MSRIDFTPALTTATSVCAELGEVGGDVEARLGAAVHAAEPTRDEDADAGQAASRIVAATVVAPCAAGAMT